MYSRKGTGKQKARKSKTVSVGTANKILAAVGSHVSAGAMSGGVTGRGFGASLYKPGRVYRPLDWKVVDTPKAVATLNTTGAFALLNGVQVGSAFYNRIGNEIYMKSLHLIGNITKTANATGAIAEYLRIMVVYDRQPNGANPATADLLLSYDNAGATTTTSYSHLNPNNKERFRVLADIRLTTPDDGSAAAPFVLDYAGIDFKQEVNVNRFIKLGGMCTRYKASSNPSVIGDQAEGALLLFTFGNLAAGNEGLAFSWSSRLKFES